MSAKHTPGPWRVGQEVKGSKRLVYIRIEHDGAESSLSNTSVYPHRRDGSTFATETQREAGEDRPAPYVSDEECRANAHLIAAAPEMLDMLKRLLRHPGFAKPFEKSTTMMVMRALVDKAEGRS